jgi:hypothetical protein
MKPPSAAAANAALPKTDFKTDLCHCIKSSSNHFPDLALGLLAGGYETPCRQKCRAASKYCINTADFDRGKLKSAANYFAALDNSQVVGIEIVRDDEISS